MKNLILSAITLAFVSVSCNQKNNQTTKSENTTVSSSNELFSCPMHPEITGKKGSECSKCGMELTESVKADSEKIEANTIAPVSETTSTQVAQITFSVDEIVSNYLILKNALTKDDSKNASSAAKKLLATFNKVDANTIDVKLKNDYLDIADDAKEHAAHIGDNAGKLDHQREHFVMLSKDVNDLIETFGAKQKLYQDFCPMANEGKGAIWISEVKDIKNPYQGSKMLTCGSMKKVF